MTRAKAQPRTRTTTRPPAPANGHVPNGTVTYPTPTGAVKASTIPLHAPAPQVFTTMVTPAIAEEWLGRNSHNRPLRNGQVEFLSGAITRGEWRMNADTIRWSTDGVLLDGQHRLWAVAMTGVSVPSMVAVGLGADVQETMDYGARRSLTDALRLRGLPNASTLASTLTYWWRYQTGNIRYASVKPSIAQALTILDENPSFKDTVADVNYRFKKRFRGSVAMMAAVLYELRSIDSDDADEWFNSLIEGVNLKAHDPILVLRKHFEAQSITSQGARSSALVTHAFCIKSWNFWRDGKQIDRLSWKASGTKAEPFPEPH